MKKTALLFMAMAAWQALPAMPHPQTLGEGEGSGFPYLTFETTDGAKVSVATKALTLAISGTTLTAGQHTFDLTSLAKMYFTNIDETAGIDDVERSTQSDERSTFNIHRSTFNVYRSASNTLKKGLNIVKTKQGTKKILVK